MGPGYYIFFGSFFPWKWTTSLNVQCLGVIIHQYLFLWQMIIGINQKDVSQYAYIHFLSHGARDTIDKNRFLSWAHHHHLTMTHNLCFHSCGTGNIWDSVPCQVDASHNISRYKLAEPRFTHIILKFCSARIQCDPWWT